MTLCPGARQLTSTLDASFAAALLLQAESATILHRNFHATLLLLSDHEPVGEDDNNKEHHHHGDHAPIHLSHWVQVPKASSSSSASPLDTSSTSSTCTWEELFASLETDNEDNGGRETWQCALTKDGMAVTMSVARLEPCPCCQRTYVTAYLRTEASKLSVDEVSALQLDKDLVDASFDPMFVIDEDGVILMVNEATIRTFGYSYNELLHQSIGMVCGGAHGPSHGTYVKRYLATGESKVMGKVRKLPARRKDGSEFPVELGVKEISSSDGIHKRLFVGYMKDVTIHEQHEKELLHKESLMQSMINASFDPMFQVNEKGIILMVNNAAVSLFGYTREEYLGHNIQMICGGEHAAQHDGYLQRYLQTGEKHVIGRKRTVPAKRKDGTEFDIELALQEVIVDDGQRVFCGYIRDITQQRLAQRALRRKDQELKGKFFGS